MFTEALPTIAYRSTFPLTPATVTRSLIEPISMLPLTLFTMTAKFRGEVNCANTSRTERPPSYRPVG